MVQRRMRRLCPPRKPGRQGGAGRIHRGRKRGRAGLLSAGEASHPPPHAGRVGSEHRARRKGLGTVTTMPAAEPTRRDFLFVATGAAGAIGAAATLVPLITQMNPDASTIAAGAPIEVELGPIAEGQIIKVFWRGKPIYISHRTKKEIEEARDVPLSSLPDPQADKDRVQPGHDEWLVVIGICTHLGCIPLAHQGDYGGWF